MKIFINKFNLTILKDIQTALSGLLVRTDVFATIYTDEGIFEVDSKQIHLLEPIDGEIQFVPNYWEELTFLVDTSSFTKTLESGVWGTQHLCMQTHKSVYKLHSKSRVSFVIEMLRVGDVLQPNDVYFETSEIVDIEDRFIKEEIVQILSLIH